LNLSEASENQGKHMNSGPLPEKTNGRRNFLRKSITLIGSAFALSAPMHSKAELTVESSDRPTPPSKGYQETEHVRTYYEKARF
jgi:hypothetical protein